MSDAADLAPDLLHTLEEVAEALSAMAVGDPEPYRRCWADTNDSTLYGAFGTIERGRESIDETLGWVAGRFANGELAPHYDVIHAYGDLAYTVGREVGTAQLDGAEPKPIMIRVTHIYRRIEGRGWCIVHRHGDHPPELER
ncbi:YybH family protein [Rathayibacter toxicus]|uniref:YybH family protein n=1 Tax=Rathayibacter toxicus TaxID=145458 RepID=UPI001C04C894|nr:nuclear transport factor 2 family protein [Rathayibacter toxicus]QWL31140.1 nuclear transport factor 2 family protein [Rathayibacter toxicus]QWL33224.1 nuclear transport factor 2 family protein [Rathayibacter toxicus]QWL35319.1 nuclear transport factor 2 family protein [Rathayibacter toxicus]QWL37450.1 nuclear transport factor 2 family protein [Rathayibacter toxicus]QWL39543.1 nuclear transport factor 2 family protein [Rathayibacter toxicus]